MTIGRTRTTRASAPTTNAGATSAGRPLDPDISRAILDATLELLSREGYAGVSIAEVAQRAGVHKPAVYRRWPGKLELAIAAVEQVSTPPVDPDRGDTRADLVEILLASVRRHSGNYPLALVLRLRAEISLDPELSAAVDEHFIAPRRAIVRAVIGRGIARGDFRSDVDSETVIDLLFGSMWARMLAGHDTLRRVDAERIVNALVEGLRAT